MAVEQLSWVAVDGVVTNLSDDENFTYYVPGPNPPDGIYGLPVEIISHQIPLVPGVTEEFVQIDANDIRFPLWMHHTDLTQLDNLRRMLSEAMRPSRGVGSLLYQTNDGSVRQLFCRETSRLRNVVERRPGWIQFGLEFSAADPFWYDENFTSIVVTPSGEQNFFQNPFFPLHMSASGQSTSFTVVNSGQYTAYPIWTLNGPLENPVLTNNTTGEVLTSSITLIAGQALTIDTRQKSISVFREDGSNQWATIADVSQMWGFAVGPNSIAITLSGSSAATTVQIQYKQAYEGV